MKKFEEVGNESPDTHVRGHTVNGSHEVEVCPSLQNYYCLKLNSNAFGEMLTAPVSSSLCALQPLIHVNFPAASNFHWKKSTGSWTMIAYTSTE